MAEVDCSAVLHMAALVSPEVCAAARATIRAAEIQGKATRQAGGLTLVAGISTLIAGVLAYVAAGRQIRQQATRVDAEVSAVQHDIDVGLSVAQRQIKTWLRTFEAEPDDSFITPTDQIYTTLEELGSVLRSGAETRNFLMHQMPQEFLRLMMGLEEDTRAFFHYYSDQGIRRSYAHLFACSILEQVAQMRSCLKPSSPQGRLRDVLRNAIGKVSASS